MEEKKHVFMTLDRLFWSWIYLSVLIGNIALGVTLYVIGIQLLTDRTAVIVGDLTDLVKATKP